MTHRLASVIFGRKDGDEEQKRRTQILTEDGKLMVAAWIDKAITELSNHEINDETVNKEVVKGLVANYVEESGKREVTLGRKGKPTYYAINTRWLEKGSRVVLGDPALFESTFAQTLQDYSKKITLAGSSRFPLLIPNPSILEVLPDLAKKMPVIVKLAKDNGVDIGELENLVGVMGRDTNLMQSALLYQKR